jgi:hypothetical protein
LSRISENFSLKAIHNKKKMADTSINVVTNI